MIDCDKMNGHKSMTACIVTGLCNMSNMGGSFNLIYNIFGPFKKNVSVLSHLIETMISL